MNALEDLGAYLTWDKFPDDCMTLSDLDEFMHGVACCPVLILIEKWMVVALGDTTDDFPSWVFETDVTIYINIVERLTSEPPVVEAIF